MRNFHLNLPTRAASWEQTYCHSYWFQRMALSRELLLFVSECKFVFKVHRIYERYEILLKLKLLYQEIIHLFYSLSELLSRVSIFPSLYFTCHDSMIQINLDDPPSSDVQRKIVVRVFQKFNPVSNLIKFKWLVMTTLKWLPATPPQSKIVGGVHSITCWVLTRGSQWCCQ